MQNTVEAEESAKKEGEYVALLMQLEEQKHKHKQELRPLLWYRNIFIVFFIILISYSDRTYSLMVGLLLLLSQVSLSCWV